MIVFNGASAYSNSSITSPALFFDNNTSRKSNQSAITVLNMLYNEHLVLPTALKCAVSMVNHADVLLLNEMSIEPIHAPSILANATKLAPASTTQMSILVPISSDLILLQR
jgi:hypothetical protein